MKYEKKNSTINDMELHKQVIDYIYRSGYKNLLLAFSGGLDSTVLLDILTILRNEQQAILSHSTQPITLRAIHIHHGLSKYADYWVYHCEQQCKQRNVPFNVFSVKLSDISEGIEASARKVRYDVLRNNLLSNEVLLTGHHQDDQAETFLLALKRGSGPAGLASMGMDTVFYEHRLLRPLLPFSKENLIFYAKERKISFIEDDSNSNDRFDRNFIRKYIIQIKQRWPKFCNAVARSARLCADQEKIIDELLIKNINELMNPDGSLYFTPLIKMNFLIIRAILRRWLASNGIKMPSCKQIDNILHDVVLSRRDAKPQIKVSYRKLLCRFRNRLYILPVQSLISLDNIILQWPTNEEHLFLPKDIGLLTRKCVYYKHILDKSLDNTSQFSVIRAPRDDEKVYIRFGSVSGRLNIIGRHRSRKLKKIWQELAVPPWLRKIIPLLYYNNILIAALGFFVTKDSKLNNTYLYNKWIIYWINKKNI